MTRRTLLYMCISAATAFGIALQPSGLDAAGRGEGHHAHATRARVGTRGFVHANADMGSYWFEASTPTIQTAGKSFSVTITVRDSNNGVATGYTGTVTLSDQYDSGATMPAPYTFTTADKGVHTFSGIVMDRAWVHDLTIQDDSGNRSFTSVPVVPATAAHVQVLTLGNIITGRQVPVFVTLWDAFGNVAWNSVDRLQLANSPGSVTLTSSYTLVPSDYGSKRFVATFNTAGSQTLKVTDVNRNLTGSTTISVAQAGAPQTFTVNSTSGSFECNGNGQPGYTLPCAIIDANNAPANSPKTIQFNIPSTDGGCSSGVCVIRPSSGCDTAAASVKAYDDPTALPEVTANYVTVDGTKQPGWSANTNALHSAGGDNAHITVQLDGSNVCYAGGLELSGNSEVVQGLSITNFQYGPGLDLFDTANNMTTTTSAIHTHDVTTDTALGDTIVGNLIGVTPGNLAAGNLTGIAMVNGPGLDTIGGTTPSSRNVISNSQQAGIDEGTYCDPYPSSGSPCANVGHNTIQGNYVGTDMSGSAAMPNDQALLNSSAALYAGFQGEQQFDQVGGYDTDAGNLFSGNGGYGFEIGAFTKVQGNYVGTDPTGMSSVANSQILIQNSPISSLGADAGGGFDFVGGTVSGARNLFSGNPQIQLEDSGGYNIIQGNYIGTNATGAGSVPCMSLPSFGGYEDGYGVTAAIKTNTAPASCPSAPFPAGMEAGGGGDFIGLITSGTGGVPANVISGNTGYGLVSDGGDNLIQGNLVGTTASGGNDGNTQAGIYGDGGGDVIGTTAKSSGNTVAYNQGDGIFTDVGPNYIQQNTITNNGGDGVQSTGGEDMIGDGVPAAGNSIGGNTGAGIEFDSGLSFAMNNSIGLIPAKANAASPNQDGIDVFGANGVQIVSNTIANNRGNGVTVGQDASDSAANALISLNSMYNDGGAGISLAGEPGSCSAPPPPPGPNNNIPCPVITTSTGKIAGTAPAGSTIEVFIASKGSGAAGEGKTFLGSTIADGTGKWTLAPPYQAAISSGQAVTATATLPETSLPAITSEFSQNAIYTVPTPVPVAGGTYTGSYAETGSCAGKCTFSITGNGTGSGPGSMGSASVSWTENESFPSSTSLTGSITGGQFTFTQQANHSNVLVANISGGSTTRTSDGRSHTDTGQFSFSPSASAGTFAGTTGGGSFKMTRNCSNCAVFKGGTFNLTLSNVTMATP